MGYERVTVEVGWPLLIRTSQKAYIHIVSPEAWELNVGDANNVKSE